MSQLPEFIYRAKLEAAMLQVDVAHFASKKPHPTVEDYATAVLALLDAETTEEWGAITVGLPPVGVVSGPLAGGKLAAEKMSASGYFAPISRRVVRTPWLPSEGGES